MLSIIGKRKIILSILTMVFLIVGVQGTSYADPNLTVTLTSNLYNPYGVYNSVVPGQRFNLIATVTNIGAEASTATTLQAYYSLNQTTDISPVGNAITVQPIPAGGTSSLYIPVTAEYTVGTYYYRVQIPAGASSNYTLVQVTNPFDLTVDTPTADKTTLAPSESFTLSTIVRNQGAGTFTGSATLRYYRSTDTTLSVTDDTQVGTDTVIGTLAGYNNTSSQSITLTAPSDPGTYYYFAYVVPVPGESNIYQNDSSYLTIVVSAPPDLVVDLFEFRLAAALAPGERFTLDATVTNKGEGQSARTTLRFYESIDRRFRNENEIDRVSVGPLSKNSSSHESIRLIAPSEPGTYYYRVHVDAVANEEVTYNNWSGYIAVFVDVPLVIESLQPTQFTLAPRETFTLTATLKNDGDTPSTRTAVQSYLSDDDSITSRDTSLDRNFVSAIAAGQTSQVHFSLTAPNAAGTYYYGVCVGDTISRDTCSVIKITVVAVLIAESQRPPMYWVDADAGTLQSLTGSSVDRLVPNVQNATSVAVDIAGGKIYWAERTSNRTGRIQRANLNGSNVELVRALTSVPHGLALDTANDKLYLTNAWGKVQRMNLDGSDFQTDLITHLTAPRGIAVDAAGGKVYWTEQTGDSTGRIQRADLDGSNIALVRALKSVPHGLALDTTNGKLYLTNAWGRVQRMNLNGSGFQPNLITNLASPRGIAVDVAGQKIYWTEAGKIRRANLDGSNPQDVATGVGTPDGIFLRIAPVEILIRESQRPPMYWVDASVGTLQSLTGSSVDRLVPNIQNATSIAVDMAVGKVYWAERTSDSTGRIQRANLNGSNVELVRALTSVPHGLALDTTNGKLYLTNAWGKVQRMNLNGSDYQADLITHLTAPRGIAVDAAGGKVYWTEQTSDRTGRIRRANLNGSNVELVRALTSVPHGLALDTANGKLYLTNAWGKVQRMNLDGSGFQADLITHLASPRGIAVDVAGRKIYWAAASKIQRANLDGSNPQDVATGVGTPAGIALGVASHTRVASAPQTVAVAPTETALHPNYPNPFNPETWIPYQLQKPAEVQIAIYSQSGVLVRELALGYQRAGQYMARSRAAYWDGRNQFGEPVASGLYFYTLTAGDFSATRRMLILK